MSSTIRDAAFQITELDCAEEARVLRETLERRGGVLGLNFDLLRGRMRVTFDAATVDEPAIIRWVADAGMTARPWLGENGEDPQRFGDGLRVNLTVAAGLLGVVGFLLHWWTSADLFGSLGWGESTPPWLACGAYLLALASAFALLAPKAWAALKAARLDMNVLIVLATVGALVLGEWLEAVTVSFLFCVALILEQWSVGRARRAVSSLMDRAPEVAHLRGEDGAIVDTPVERTEVGALMIIRPGERVPLDGRLRSGESTMDQSPITGESMPVEKRVGDDVYAGAINGEGLIEVTVTRRAEDSVLSRILRMVEDSATRRAPVERWVESFARYYTPTVMSLAAALALGPPLVTGADWSECIYFALVLLVIACPCALVISTPVSIVAALSSAARQGVLIKGGRFLEAFASVDAVAMDKTGTLTRGRPEVRRLAPSEGVSEADLLRLAVSLESHSSHPLAAAIRAAADRRGVESVSVDEYQMRGGLGAEAVIEGRRHWIGSARLLQEKTGSESPSPVIEQMRDEGMTIVAVGREDEVVGLIGIADAPRSSAADVVQQLRELGVRRIVMLTGDHEAAAKSIARSAGIDEFHAASMPEDKARMVEKLVREHRMVAMIGDGVNDGPALASAHVGVAMGAIGSDAAIEAADIALMADDLSKTPWLIRHARRALAIVRQNIAIALGMKIVFGGLAIFGAAYLWLAIAADMGASLLVIFNGLRLLKA